MLGADAPAESLGRSCPSPWMRARVATGCSKKTIRPVGFFYLRLDLQLLLSVLVAAPPVPSGPPTLAVRPRSLVPILAGWPS